MNVREFSKKIGRVHEKLRDGIRKEIGGVREKINGQRDDMYEFWSRIVMLLGYAMVIIALARAFGWV